MKARIGGREVTIDEGKVAGGTVNVRHRPRTAAVSEGAGEKLRATNGTGSPPQSVVSRGEEVACRRGLVPQGTARGLAGTGCSPAGDKPAPPPLSFTLLGQVSGGKNNIGITKQGHRFPNRSFAKWREAAVRQLTEQINRRYRGATVFFPKPQRVGIIIRYTPGDLLRRDMPAIEDALFHVLERCKVVEDDAQIKEGHYCELALDRERPRVELVIHAAPLTP